MIVPHAGTPKFLRLTRVVELLGDLPKLRKLAERKSPSTDP